MSRQKEFFFVVKPESFFIQLANKLTCCYNGGGKCAIATFLQCPHASTSFLKIGMRKK